MQAPTNSLEFSLSAAASMISAAFPSPRFFFSLAISPPDLGPRISFPLANKKASRSADSSLELSVTSLRVCICSRGAWASAPAETVSFDFKDLARFMDHLFSAFSLAFLDKQSVFSSVFLAFSFRIKPSSIEILPASTRSVLSFRNFRVEIFKRCALRWSSSLRLPSVR